MPAPDKTFIRNAFNSITPHYDALNQVLSFGMSEAWRRQSAAILFSDPRFSPKTLLDLGCGTGQFLKCFMKMRTWDNMTGVDFSDAMLEKARKTVLGNVSWLREDFDTLPFLGSSFDLVISGFTLRSVQKLPEFLDSVYRILTPGGKAAFLDLTRPRNFWVCLFFLPYLKFLLPFIGGLLSGNLEAYRFLSGSIRHFQSPEETVRLMRAAGFRDLTTKSFSFGTATLIIGTK
ncbi:MAG: ubiquinone/menaquinone biosynthesis methyltransferase [Candidatus Omnitrophota bacterium]